MAPSSLALLTESAEAFTLRITLARLATRSLDLQYYIWDDDTTGKLLIYRVLEAARRGVKVRLLLDHANQLGRDVKWAVLDAHPNIEIRLFNPFRRRYKHVVQWLHHVPQLNHRMHNKAWIMDGEQAIVGGRNIADHYFGLNPLSNFRDLDLYAQGPVVADTRDAFEAFWNSPVTLPLRQFFHRREHSAERLWRRLARWRRALRGYPYVFPQHEDFFTDYLQRLQRRCVMAPAVVLFDSPSKAEGATQALLGEQLAQVLARHAHQDILMETSYLIPGQDFIREMHRLHQQGARIAILTNSLATNDVVAAHAGYARYREDLLEAGVELHELQPTAKILRWQRLLKGRARSSLHTKAMVLDRREVFVGSFNMDPRSLNLNTEMGYYVASPELGELVAAFIEEGLAPNNSYRLAISEGRLSWHGEEEQGLVHRYQEPATSRWRRLLATLVAVLPIERWL